MAVFTDLERLGTAHLFAFSFAVGLELFAWPHNDPVIRISSKTWWQWTKSLQDGLDFSC